MGYNTALMICNDHLHEIEDDSAFGARVADAQRAAFHDGAADRNSFTVLRSQHADYDQLVIVGGNTIRSMSNLTRDQAKTVLRQAAWEAGLKVAISNQ